MTGCRDCGDAVPMHLALSWGHLDALMRGSLGLFWTLANITEHVSRTPYGSRARASLDLAWEQLQRSSLAQITTAAEWGAVAEPPQGGDDDDGGGEDDEGGGDDDEGGGQRSPGDGGDGDTSPCCCAITGGPQVGKTRQGITSRIEGEFLLGLKTKCEPTEGADCKLEWWEYGTHEVTVEYKVGEGEQAETKVCTIPAGSWQPVKKICPDLENWTKPMAKPEDNPQRFTPIDEAFHCSAECPPDERETGVVDTPGVSLDQGERTVLRWGLIRVTDGCSGEVHEFRWFFGAQVDANGQAVPGAVFEAPFPPNSGPTLRPGSVYRPPPVLPPTTGSSDAEQAAERRKWEAKESAR